MAGGGDDLRIEALRRAEAKALKLFDRVIELGLVVPGKTERALSDEIRDLSSEMFGTRRYWHKRVVRAGVNTLEPYAANPPDRALAEDDIVFFDFGPIFEEWEADVGRTYVVGEDPIKHRLVRGRKHAEDLRTVVDAMLYIAQTGCQGRYLPASFGP